MSALYNVIGKRILVLDGALGTLLQAKQLQEHQFRGKLYHGSVSAGDRFRNHTVSLSGNYDVLSITYPAALYDVHYVCCCTMY